MGAHRVCSVSELPAGERRIVEADGRSIGVFNINGRLFAIRNRCPHQGAPLCRGLVTGTMSPSAPGVFDWQREGEIVRCPWHGWEFDITTGRSIFNPHRTRVKRYTVTVEQPDPSLETFPVSVSEGAVFVHL
jgi:nitrite reductase/ring-hydroxylating ferredoxin subunit